MITVKNIRKEGEDWEDYRIFRGYPLGNPYSHLDDSLYDTIKVKSREVAIEKYKVNRLFE